MPKLTIFITFILCLLASNIGLSDDHLKSEVAPEEFLQYFIAGFNSENKEILKKVFNRPLIRVSNGKVTSYLGWDEYIDYDRIKATGWRKSIINSSSVPYQDENSAILKMNFSRVNSEGATVVRSDVTYMLIKGQQSWKIAAVIIPGVVPVSSDD